MPIKVNETIIKKLKKESLDIEIDLEKQLIITSNEQIHFDIGSYQKKILLAGLDDIALTLQYEDKIANFEKNSIIPSVL